MFVLHNLSWIWIMFIEYIYIYIWTVQPWNGTPKHSETETFHSNWKNKTELTILDIIKKMSNTRWKFDVGFGYNTTWTQIFLEITRLEY